MTLNFGTQASTVIHVAFNARACDAKVPMTERSALRVLDDGRLDDSLRAAAHTLAHCAASSEPQQLWWPQSALQR